MLVSYYADHRGHDFEVAHMRLRREQREGIAAKLAAGVPRGDVLDAIRSSASTSGCPLLKFVTKKDIQNISRQFGVPRNLVRHDNDADSVAAWVELAQQESSTQNLVRFVKYQGEECDLELCEVEDVPEVEVEVKPILGPGVLPALTECQVRAIQCSNDVEWQLMKADDLWLSIRNCIATDVNLVNVAMEHMTKLKSLVSALRTHSDTLRLPPPRDSCREPANKKAEKQRTFPKTKKVKQRTPKIIAPKPTHGEKEFLLNTLSGNTAVVSHEPPLEHDHDGSVISHAIHCEHSYTGN